MTGEGGEYNEHRHEADEDEAERVVREIIDEVRKEIEERETSEVEEETEDVRDAEECVREAIEEIGHEEEERQRAMEEYEAREHAREEELEESHEEREARADRDDFAELEERVLENFEDHGIDSEDVKERWRERFEEDVEEHFDGSKEGNGEEEGGEELTVESEMYYTDSNGLVHVIETESSETAEARVEPALEEPEQQESSETSDSPESRGVEPSIEESGITSQDEQVSGTKEECVEDSYVLEDIEVDEEAEKQVLVSELKEVALEGPSSTEETKIPYSESEPSSYVDEPFEGHIRQENQETQSVESDAHLDSSSEVEEEHDKPQRHEHQESYDPGTGHEESSEEPESGEEEIWTSYEINNSSIEDEEWKRYLRETFNAISEEEKEAFKKYLRSEVHTIEEFEELLRKYGLEELLDKDEVMEEVGKFLELKQALVNDSERSVEEIAEELEIDVEQALEWSRGESEPLSYKRLLNLEGYYLWDEILRSYRERDLPKTREELEQALAEREELRTSRFLSIEKEEAVAWIEITEMRRRGEIKRIIRNGRELYHREQIKELREKYGIATNEVVRWLRGETVPSLIESASKVVGNQGKKAGNLREVDAKEVHRLYFDEGLTMLETAKRLGFKSAKPVQRVFKEQQWTPRAPGSQRSSIDLDEVHRLYFIEGLTLREIAQRVGIEKHTLGKIFREQGWETSRTAAMKQTKTIAVAAENTRTKVIPKRKRIKPIEVYQLYCIDGLTLKETAERLGLKTTRPIRRILKDHRWTVKPQERIDFIELHRLHLESNLSLGKIAKAAGLTVSSIRKAFKERGLKTRYVREKRESPDIDRVYELYYEEGLTKEEVAEELNASESSIRKVFREMGWPSKIRKFDSETKRTVAKEESKQEIAGRIVELRKRLFGIVCRICGANNKQRTLIIHKKDGAEHKKDILWRARFLRSVNPEQYAALCPECHPGVHWMMNAFNLEYEQIKHMSELNRGKSSEEKPPYEIDAGTQVSDTYLEIKRSKRDNDVDVRRLLFGESCFLCGAHHSEKTLTIHRKDGRPHNPNLIRHEKNLSKLNPNEWVSLCQRCHRETHWAMSKLGISWIDLERMRLAK
jgi:AraC-like DNA-binding protein